MRVGLLAAGSATLGLALLAACADAGVTVGGPTSGLGDPRAGGRFTLVGRWTRIETAGPGYGSGYAYQTTWAFAPGGSAVRSVQTLAPSGAVLESFAEPAAWAADGGTVAVTFGSPVRVTRYFRYRVEVGAARTVLYLDSVPFTRTGP